MRRADICALTANVGRNGFYGHRVYAVFSHLTDSDLICFLHQDNWLEPDHVASLLDAIETNAWDWAFVFRNVVDSDGAFLVHDEWQSVGPWNQTSPHKLVDTNCYCLRMSVAQRFASHLHGGLRQDRAFYAALSQGAPNYGTTGQYTVNYRMRGDLQDAVINLLVRENFAMHARYPDGLPWLDRNTVAPHGVLDSEAG
ncbi:hypothetical protein SAMN02787142_7625 [Burkholderia sp. WP9]|nr:hypothetical protein SAMN02787142_7625 [Burkholderia sp. WP9]